MACPLCNDTGDQRYWEGRWRNADAENAKLRAALTAFADHFGPLEDNHMLSDGARNCFKLARNALGLKE